MDNKEREDLAKELLKDSEIFRVMSVEAVNFNPHQYVIGPKHIEHASRNFGGILDERTVNTIPCAYPNCNLSYDEHHHDCVLFVQLKRNATNDEVVPILKSLAEKTHPAGVDGIAFVDTPEKFRIN